MKRALIGRNFSWSLATRRVKTTKLNRPARGLSNGDIALFRERILNIANYKISRRYQRMFDIRHRQPVLLTFVAVAVVPIKRRNLQFHRDNVKYVLSNVNTNVNVN